MNTADLYSIKPRTLDGIKQLAKKIKKAQNVGHTTALDVAAKQAGYENFRHAFNAMRVATATP